MKGFKDKSGKFRPTGSKSKSTLKKSDVKRTKESMNTTKDGFRRSYTLEDLKTIGKEWDNATEEERKKIIINTHNGYTDGHDANIVKSWSELGDYVKSNIANDWDNAHEPFDESRAGFFKVSRGKESIDKPSYWGENGKYQKEADILQKLVPNEGQSEFTDVELFRVASNIYYEMKNNGGGNLADDYENDEEYSALGGAISSSPAMMHLENYLEIKHAGDKSQNYNDYSEWKEYGDEDVPYTSSDEVESAWDKLEDTGVMDDIMDAVIEKIKTMPKNHLQEGGFVRSKESLDSGKTKHGIAIRDRRTGELIEFIETATGRSALQVLSGVRINMGSDYKAEEDMVSESEIAKIK